MFAATQSDHAPWTVVIFNDQKRGRPTLIRDLLVRLPNMRVRARRSIGRSGAHEPFEEKSGLLTPIPDCPLDR